MMVILAFNELRILKAIPLESQKPLNLPGISIYIYYQIPNQKKKSRKKQKKLRIWTLFTQCKYFQLVDTTKHFAALNGYTLN